MARSASRKHDRATAYGRMTNARDEPLPSSPIHGEGCRSQGILGRLTLYNGELHFQFTFSRSGRTWCARTVRAIECIGSGGKDSCASGWLRSSATFPGDAPSAVQSNCSKREAYGRARAIRAGRRGKFPAVQPNNCTGSPRVNRKRSRCCLSRVLLRPPECHSPWLNRMQHTCSPATAGLRDIVRWRPEFSPYLLGRWEVASRSV